LISVAIIYRSGAIESVSGAINSPSLAFRERSVAFQERSLAIKSGSVPLNYGNDAIIYGNGPIIYRDGRPSGTSGAGEIVANWLLQISAQTSPQSSGLLATNPSTTFSSYAQGTPSRVRGEPGNRPRARSLHRVRPQSAICEMSSIKSAPEKKRLAYECDHYNRGGENNKTWRKTKQVKKAVARRIFRKAANDTLKAVDPADPDATSEPRKKQAIRQKPVVDWGSIHLRAFVATRRRSRDTQKLA
jgi:hypothetical protein